MFPLICAAQRSIVCIRSVLCVCRLLKNLSPLKTWTVKCIEFGNHDRVNSRRSFFAHWSTGWRRCRVQIVSVEHDLHRTKGVKQRSHRPRTFIRSAPYFLFLFQNRCGERGAGKSTGTDSTAALATCLTRNFCLIWYRYLRCHLL